MIKPTDIAVAPAGPRELEFFDGFDQKAPGDVILQADDARAGCFYFRLSLLAELSNFFANLPTPSAEDMVDGVPLIPLHNTNTYGLNVYLCAIKSIISMERYDFFESPGGMSHMLDATVTAKMYDAPVVHRILLDSLRLHSDVPRPYLEFAILAITGSESSLPNAATSTLSPDVEPISEIERYIVNNCREHAMVHWFRLQALHLRHTQAATAFRNRIRVLPSLIRPFASHRHSETNSKVCANAQAATEVRIFFLGMETPSEIEEARTGNFGLTCETCLVEAFARYTEHFVWLSNFAYDYMYDEHIIEG